MPSRATSGVAVYMAWNTSTNVFAKGDAGNHTIRFIKDGVVTTPTNAAAITEASSGGAPTGAYQIAWTSAEGTANTLWVGGQSSTANVVIIPITIGFENLPNLPTTLLVTGSGVNVSQWLGVAPAALVATLVQTQQSGNIAGNVSGSVASVAGSVASVTSGVNLTQWLGVTPAPLVNALVQAQVSGTPGTNLTQWLGSVPAPLVTALVQTQTSGPVSSVTGAVGSVGGNVVGSVASVTGAVGSVTGNVGGNVVGSVASVTGAVGSVTGSVASVTSGVNMTQIAGAVVNTATAQIGANVVSYASGQSPAIQVWDLAAPIEDSITPRGTMVYLAAVNMGVTTGALTSTFAIQGMSSGGITRVSLNTDQSGNRSGINLT